MIPRYTRPEMGKIWSDDNKFATWLQVELLACEAQSELGLVPGAALTTIKAKAGFDVAAILEIEETVKHDVIAFLTNIAAHVGTDSRYIHLGMTSSDLLDTALAVQLKQAGEQLMVRLAELHAGLRKKAVQYKMTVCCGRSHGVHAEPTTFGLKLAVWYVEVERHLERLRRATAAVAVGKISGAVGTYAHLDPFVEAYVCRKLGLAVEPVSTQIVQRDRHAEFLNVLAMIGSSLDKFATEIRHLQRTEVLEAEEPFAKGQKGSSAMPHKRNPIMCERISGLARVLRANAIAGMEDVALWHERDISHSSVERVVLPDSTILLDYMLHLFIKVMRDLQVYPENMQRNLERTGGLMFSQRVLLALAQKGMTREEAYRIVQEHAMGVWQSLGQSAANEARDFETRLKADRTVKQYLDDREIETCFDLSNHLRHVTTIFQRLGLE